MVARDIINSSPLYLTPTPDTRKLDVIQIDALTLLTDDQQIILYSFLRKDNATFFKEMRTNMESLSRYLGLSSELLVALKTEFPQYRKNNKISGDKIVDFRIFIKYLQLQVTSQTETQANLRILDFGIDDSDIEPIHYQNLINIYLKSQRKGVATVELDNTGRFARFVWNIVQIKARIESLGITSPGHQTIDATSGRSLDEYVYEAVVTAYFHYLQGGERVSILRDLLLEKKFDIAKESIPSSLSKADLEHLKSSILVGPWGGILLGYVKSSEFPPSVIQAVEIITVFMYKSLIASERLVPET